MMVRVPSTWNQGQQYSPRTNSRICSSVISRRIVKLPEVGKMRYPSARLSKRTGNPELRITLRSR